MMHLNRLIWDFINETIYKKGMGRVSLETAGDGAVPRARNRVTILRLVERRPQSKGRGRRYQNPEEEMTELRGLRRLVGESETVHRTPRQEATFRGPPHWGTREPVEGPDRWRAQKGEGECPLDLERLRSTICLLQLGSLLMRTLKEGNLPAQLYIAVFLKCFTERRKKNRWPRGRPLSLIYPPSCFDSTSVGVLSLSPSSTALSRCIAVLASLTWQLELVSPGLPSTSFSHWNVWKRQIWRSLFSVFWSPELLDFLTGAFCLDCS